MREWEINSYYVYLKETTKEQIRKGLLFCLRVLVWLQIYNLKRYKSQLILDILIKLSQLAYYTYISRCIFQKSINYYMPLATLKQGYDIIGTQSLILN